ncbi:serine/threonine-protein kinase Sgk2-like isoform X1 [Petromyzon marinus]|uniref:non-specific serine/threonine protein kinase n=2 Tax=Petromyzon marinus TaxID=7757 RepID=A0AAJ7WW05_PETMA|nr:serine/threonine-protein kinase Sgk2-like isoform X1 [Petromyzon marinus]
MGDCNHFETSHPSASVSDSLDIWEKRAHHTVYKVVVSNEGKSWFVLGRYAEFYKLYQSLKNTFPEMHLKFPPRRNFGSHFDPAFLKHRKTGLNDFTQKVVSNPGMCQNPDVRKFLQLDNPRNQTQGPMADEDHINMNDADHINLGPSANLQAKPSDFDFLTVLGKGSFGKVLLAKHKSDGIFYAVKVMKKSIILQKKEEKHIMAERNVLVKNVRHPFLVGLHYSFQSADKLYFVMDYVNGGELFFHLQRQGSFPESRAQFYAAEIGSAIGYLHSLNIVYRDLKPENILLDYQGHIVLTDFGLCKEGIDPHSTTCTFCGTPEYLAPEVLKKHPYDRTVDWWCLGCVLYEMLYGLPPFYSKNLKQMYESILHQPLQLRPCTTNAAISVLEGLLHKDPHQRLGATSDILEIKNHVFFSTINWNDLDAKRIPSPYNPGVSGPCDLHNFDPAFTAEPLSMSMAQSSDTSSVCANVDEAADAFVGFTYMPGLEDQYLPDV